MATIDTKIIIEQMIPIKVLIDVSCSFFTLLIVETILIFSITIATIEA